MVDVEKILKEDRLYPDYDPELQLRIVQQAVDRLLTLQDESRQAISPYSDEPSDEFHRLHYEDVFYDFCYTPVVVSQSVISLLASFLEGLFRHEVEFLCTLINGKIRPGTHHRCGLEQDKFWDVTVRSKDGVSADKANIAIGVWQILKSLQITDCFAANFHSLTKLIFEYRNFSMHNGFEWSQEKREKFQLLLTENQFKNFKQHFSWSKSGDNLWMVSINKEFIEDLVNFCGELPKSFDDARKYLIDEIKPINFPLCQNQ